MAANTPDPKYRVKVYELNEEGEWGDKGTGHVQFQMVQSVEAAYMFVHSEVDSSLLLESKVIMEDDVYQRQGDTIVSWNEPYSRQDLALSFAEAAGCQDIWEKLCAVRGVDPTTAGQAEEEPSPPSQTYTLPPVEPGSLNQILDFLTDLSPFMREGVAATMVQEDFIKQLVELFRAAEDAENKDQLKSLYMIAKSLVMMNETNLLEQMLHDDYYLSVFGMFEYDPEQDTPHKHRDFLSKAVVFKQIIPFEDPMLVSRIHQNFRVQYLKEVVLPRVMDDATFGTLNSVIFFNSIEIVQQLENDTRFLTEVFHRLKATRTMEDRNKAMEDQKDLVGLLQEMCDLSKNLQLDARSAFFKTLHQHGIMHVFEDALCHPDLKCRLSGFDVLATVANHDASAVRVFMLEQEPEHEMLKQLIDRVPNDPDQGVKGQAAEILRLLLDPDSMDQSQEKNQFLNTFYEKFLEKLIAVFTPEFEQKHSGQRQDMNVARNHVCELLTFFVQSHGYRIKYFVLRNNIVGKVCELMGEKEKYIALSAVRFVRACVGLKDEFYFRYMIKNNSFSPLVDLFLDNGKRNNLLNSAIIELFEFIRKENIKSLIQYTTDNFDSQLKPITYVDTFTSLWAQHEKNKEFASTTDSTDNAAEEQAAEDVYFSGDADKPSKDQPAGTPSTENGDKGGAP